MKKKSNIIEKIIFPSLVLNEMLGQNILPSSSGQSASVPYAKIPLNAKQRRERRKNKIRKMSRRKNHR